LHDATSRPGSGPQEDVRDMARQEAQTRPRGRKIKILATLGPASRSPEMIAALLRAGPMPFAST